MIGRDAMQKKASDAYNYNSIFILKRGRSGMQYYFDFMFQCPLRCHNMKVLLLSIFGFELRIIVVLGQCYEVFQ